MSSSLRVNTIVPSTGTNVAIGTANGTVTFTDSVNFVLGTGSSIFSPASNTLTFGTNDEERLRITSTGRLLINASSDLENSGAAKLQITHTSGALLALGRDDSAVSADNDLGKIAFYGNDGGSYEKVAQITCEADGSHASGDKPGRLLFATTADGASSPTERLRITSDGKLGVNVTSPGCQTGGIHAVHDATEGTPTFTGGEVGIFQRNYNSSQGCEIGIIGGSNSSSRINFGDKDDADRGIISYSHNDDSMRFIVSAAEKLRILSDGKVAIGGVTANSLLDVHGGDGISLTSSGDTFLQSRTTGTTGINYLEFKDSGGAAGDISYYHNGDYMRFKTNGSERARIDSDGHLQIRREGVASMPNEDTRHTRYIIRQTNGQEAILGSVFAQGKSSWGGDLVFASKSANGSPNSGLTERMRIGSDGKFYYATTSQGPHGGFFNIDASSSARNGMNVKGTTANYAYISSAGGSSGDHIHFSNYSNSNQETGRIKDNQSNVTYYTSSDYRLKDNIVSITDGITRVKQLNPVRHTWINNPALGTVDGWIAHELDAVCPDAVDGEKDAVREDGSIEPQAADYGRITPLLAAALKEAIAKIEALEARVTTLEG